MSNSFQAYPPRHCCGPASDFFRLLNEQTLITRDNVKSAYTTMLSISQRLPEDLILDDRFLVMLFTVANY